MQRITIRSDNPGKGPYIVTINNDGVAVRCTCPGFRHHKQCKHLERAELMPAFLRARDILEASGLTRREFNARFEATVEKLGGRGSKDGRAVNKAIRRVIQAAEMLPAPGDVCGRCQGKGYIQQFSHVAHGVCFSCWGGGKKLTRKEWVSAQQEYVRLNASPAQSFGG